MTDRDATCSWDCTLPEGHSGTCSAMRTTPAPPLTEAEFAQFENALCHLDSRVGPGLAVVEAGNAERVLNAARKFLTLESELAEAKLTIDRLYAGSTLQQQGRVLDERDELRRRNRGLEAELARLRQTVRAYEIQREEVFDADEDACIQFCLNLIDKGKRTDAAESELAQLRREKAELTEALTGAQTKLQAAEHVATEHGIALAQMTDQWHAACDLVQHREELERRRDAWLRVSVTRALTHYILGDGNHSVNYQDDAPATEGTGPTYEAALAAALGKVVKA